MGDKELLKFAAKAAGHGEIWTDIDGNIYTGEPERAWNPLTDDGDAFRLQVELGIIVRGPSKSRSSSRVIQAWFPPDGNARRSATSHVTSVINGDRISAARRAIVRAAAEIGKAMP